MTDRILKRIMVRQGTSTEAATHNEVLRAGELSYETDARRMKIGDGVNKYKSILSFSEEAEIAEQIVQGTYAGQSLNDKFGFAKTGAAVDTWLAARVAAENFAGMNIGDWIDIDTGAFTLAGAGTASWGTTDENVSLAATTRRFYVAGFNIYKGTGDTTLTDTALTKNHVILCHLPTDFTCQWNRSKTNGSYVCTNNGCSAITNPWKASKAYAVLNGENNAGTSGAGNPTGCDALNKGVLQMLTEAGLDSSHLLSRRKYAETRYTAKSDLTDSTGAAWVDWGKIFAPSEVEVYGSPRHSAGKTATALNWANYGPDEWLPLFKFFGKSAGYRWRQQGFWLSSAAGGVSALADLVGGDGLAHCVYTAYARRLPVCFIFGV